METAPAQQKAFDSGGKAVLCVHRTGCAPVDVSETQVDSETVPYKTSLTSVISNIPNDQKRIWTSTFRANVKDLYWIVPFATTSGLLIGSDANNMLRARSNADAISLSKTVANAGVVGLIGVPAVMYAWGASTGRPRARETGLLTGEASINALIINETFKLALGRERPTAINGKGNLFAFVRRFTPALNDTHFHTQLGMSKMPELTFDIP